MRTVRLAALVMAAFSLGAAQPPQGSSNAQHKDAAKPATVRVAVTDFPAAKDRGCKEGETKRDSDLCAQWEAADASRKAADYSFWAVLISAIGTGFLFFTFMQTRATSRAELRAYLFPESSNIFDGGHPDMIGTNDEMVPFSSFTVRNFGSTPARDVRHWGHLMLLPPEATPPDPDMSVCAVTGYAPGGIQYFNRPLVMDPYETGCFNTFGLMPNEIEEIRGGRLLLTLFGRVTYKDVFDRERVTNYRLFYTGRWPPSDGASMQYSAAGNDAT